MAISEWELWAVAAKLIEQHGRAANGLAAERLNAMVLADDKAGRATWRGIMNRMAQLQDESGPAHSKQ